VATVDCARAFSSKVVEDPVLPLFECGAMVTEVREAGLEECCTQKSTIDNWPRLWARLGTVPDAGEGDNLLFGVSGKKREIAGVS
jgi:hypothetical protein